MTVALAVLGAIAALLGGAVYWSRRQVADLRTQLEGKRAEGEALGVEKTARKTAESALNTQLELRWAEEAEEAKRATDTDAALARWGRVLRRLSVPREDGSEGSPGTP